MSVWITLTNSLLDWNCKKDHAGKYSPRFQEESRQPVILGMSPTNKIVDGSLASAVATEQEGHILLHLRDPGRDRADSDELGGASPFLVGRGLEKRIHGQVESHHGVRVDLEELLEVVDVHRLQAGELAGDA